MIGWWRTDFGEAEASRAARAVADGHLSMGPVTEEFESRAASMLGVPHAVAVPSGSMALLIALMALGIGPGDDVIVPNQTFVATAHAVLMAGARPVLADTLPDRPILDVHRLEEVLTERTRAIIPVHLSGRLADMESLNAFAAAVGIRVIEDAAQAILSEGPAGKAGTLGDVGCYSLGVTKLLSTGQGGLAVTRDDELAAVLRSIRTHGIADLTCEVYTRPSFNFKYSDVLASIGLAQFNRALERVGQVRDVYERYAVGLAGVECVSLVPIRTDVGEVPLYVDVLCKDRARLLPFLAERGIEARPAHPPLDLAPYLSRERELPCSHGYGTSAAMLPCGPAREPSEVDEVLVALSGFDALHGSHVADSPAQKGRPA